MLLNEENERMKIVYLLAALILAGVGWTILSRSNANLADKQFKMKGTFLGSEDLSGLASLDGRNGVIVSDEPRAAQAITIDPVGHTITAGAQLPLFANEGTVEADLEAVAADELNHCYYAIGSHGASKKKGEFQEDRCHIFRIPAEGKSGVPTAKGIATGSLLPWLATQATFKGSLQRPLQQRGFNIEGLTCKAGKLYIGVRGPNVNGHTFVIEMTPEPLFNNQMPTGKIHELPVGAGQGIREIAALPVGFLVLTGNAGSEPSKQFPESLDHAEKNPYALWWWRPGTDKSLVNLLVLPKHDGKAEGLLVTKAEATMVEVIVIFDSGENGAPLTLNVSLPSGAQ
jgi:hypothetical protein